jgi:hypothetical protein
MELNKEEFEKLNSYMISKGFSLHSRSDYKMFDYCNDLAIHCEIMAKDNYTFNFSYVTPKWHNLKSGDASPLYNEKHFDRLLNNFEKEVQILEYTRN